MRTILVDDQPLTMQRFEEQCRDSMFFEVLGTFRNPVEALEFAKHTPIDFAILDIDMPQMNGFELGCALRNYYPDIIIFYVTAHEKYAANALRQKADYFISKPYSMEDVTDALFRAKLLSHRQKKTVFIRTFGNFDVFIDGLPLYFSSAKAKELLALLVDRKGGLVSTEEAMAAIWEDNSNSSLCRTAAMRLRKTLESYGIQDILIEKNGNRSANIELFDCDYLLFLQGVKEAEWAFTGEYMSQYSWGEVTLANLLQRNSLG